ncbi:MAG: polysaccharide biosynthesis C-terminal domain-containing protein [Flavobacteriales bacterium]
MTIPNIGFNIRTQVGVGAAFKLFNALALFFIVRLALDLVGSEVYGTWVTILSTITWFSFIETGITSGIRNQVTNLSEENKHHVASSLIGAGMSLELLLYSSLSAFALIALLVIPSTRLNQAHISEALVFAAIIFLSYVISMVNCVALARHKAQWPVIATFTQNLFTIAGLLLIQSLHQDSLFALGLVFSCSSLCGILLTHILLYSGQFKSLSPKFPNWDITLLHPFKERITRFGITQLFVLVIFASDHLIIVTFQNASEVTNYSIAFRYFNALNVVFNLILIPFWSAFTSADQASDAAWIKRAIRLLLMLFGALSILGILMLSLSDLAYKVWLGTEVSIRFWLSAIMMISVFLTMWNNLFIYYLSGTGDIRLYSNLVIVSGALNIPISIWLVHVFGSTGVIAATCFALLPQAILLPVKTFRKLFPKR